MGPEILLASVLSICAENLAVMTMWFGNWYEFYIVQKESDDLTDNLSNNMQEASPMLMV